ncbi:glucose/mannose transport system substrate-binding protein [Kineosphaera limosa]|uniref:Probable sugar-binding periplasmic protein n=1 Tax=Kineosphaera limosa NBRC 100340 TaxID=1184609 RepID=K6WBX5_9MICO|nr:ABC transporter substrate-binding protein [Kineosphaera limosa]NYE01832.1 glucose/mannose transport system substrate-binding protein [Kineosphaera limosa]GAB96735.1 putative ABC transporter substrate-binding protein [Kineosphaera limosa NBRC 100340]
MKRIAAVASAVTIGLTLAACGGGGATTPEAGSTGGAAGAGDASEVQVVTWWAQGSEKAGLEALEKVFATQHPDTKFVNAALAGGAGSQAKQKLQADLQAGNPPDTFQAHAGAELTDYIDAGQIEDVSALYDEFNLKQAFPENLVERLTVDGKIYSIPSNIHRANVVWANPAVLKEAGINPDTPPASIEAWIADMEKIKAKGKTPITVGMDWTQTQLLETILISDLGAEKYNGLWDGKTDWAGADVTKALTNFQKIMSFTNPDRDGLDWEPAMQKVVDGSAAYNVMGDWAVAGFDSQQKKEGTDYIWFPVPGNEKVFDFLADSFTLPVGAKHPGGSKNWLQTISSSEGQLAFNKVKGSIPARTDVDVAQLSEYQQKAMESFKNDTIVSSLAHGAAAPVAVSTQINQAVVKFTQGASDLAGFQKELVTATASLKG